ncbi:MAG: hypothetical protein R2867_12505 [Caldilineaceae bacterium]
MNEWTEQPVGGAVVPSPTTPATAGMQTPLAEPAPMSAPVSHQTAANGQPVSKALWQQRTDGLTLVAGYHFLVAALFLLGTLVMMIPTGILGIVSVVEDPDAMIAMFIVGIIAILTLGLCLLYLAVGYGLWTLKPWGRVAALALAVVSLFGFPIGTVTGGLTLWYLMQPEVAAKFE